MNAPAAHRILLVDDEPNIVNAVRRELLAPPFDFSAYMIEGYSDPRLALQRACEVAYDAVISDYRMPGMDGIEFLGELAQLQPDCMRIVLSGQSDMDTLARLVNESRIYRFIAKPWHVHYLKVALTQTLDYGKVLRENRRLVAQAAADGQALPDTGDAADAVIAPLLIVDDDSGVLNSLSRALRLHLQTDGLVAAIAGEAGYGHDAGLAIGRVDIRTAPSAAAALHLAGSESFSCVISDFRMPEMNGVELLKRFAQLQPDCSRILISGQIEQDDLRLAINQAHIFAFIDKPWSGFQLKMNVLLALSRYRMLQENRRLAVHLG